MIYYGFAVLGFVMLPLLIAVIGTIIRRIRRRPWSPSYHRNVSDWRP